MNDITKNAKSVKDIISKNLSDYLFCQIDNKVIIKFNKDIVSIIIDIPDLNKLGEVISLAIKMINTGNPLLIISFSELKKRLKDLNTSVIEKSVPIKTVKLVEVESAEKSHCMDNEEEVLDSLIINFNVHSILNVSDSDRRKNMNYNDLNLIPTSNKHHIKNTA